MFSLLLKDLISDFYLFQLVESELLYRENETDRQKKKKKKKKMLV